MLIFQYIDSKCFGANSPKTTCRYVTMINATINEIVVVSASGKWINSNNGCSNLLNVGSPNQPNPKDVTVIPN